MLSFLRRILLKALRALVPRDLERQGPAAELDRRRLEREALTDFVRAGGSIWRPNPEKVRAQMERQASLAEPD